ncbi:PH domain-containing protein [Paenibacillus methanolicus]|uniref:PH (Pleckstrin Homology) domain-containing protein n=1 Tax=Paenibacillus methanolicus TaxID=582686 RepID=A0A5S5CAW6_9BACL|nr:PH domain-containing protein [Paenibacillus methanolicus]TYP75768.1 PH (Pleckstrin Homology) domain-containing protein [Paenibacillus methanolicus]
MGLFDSIMGNASEIPVSEIQQELRPILTPGEQVEKAYKVFRDGIVFTNKRMILIDKQGVTSNKTELLSIPYKSITRFSRESAGMFDHDAELKIWLSGQSMPIVKKFNKQVNINEIYAKLSQYILG